VSPCDLTALLAAGGVPATYLDPSARDLAADEVPAYNGMLDPSATETLGRALAAELAAYRPTSVLVWENPADLILAHVVARELSTTVVRAFDADGLVGFTGGFPEHAQVVLLADAFRSQRVVQALAALVRQQRGTLVAIAELFTVPGAASVKLSGVPTVILAQGSVPAAFAGTGRPGTGPATEVRT
jgi:hypothetical protein